MNLNVGEHRAESNSQLKTQRSTLTYQNNDNENDNTNQYQLSVKKVGPKKITDHRK